jgi:hypothetical protein
MKISSALSSLLAAGIIGAFGAATARADKT